MNGKNFIMYLLKYKDTDHLFHDHRAALEEAYARSLSKLANTVFLAADHSDGYVYFIFTFI